MADIRINALPTTATDFASDDYIAIDGTTNGTRKLNAKTASLTFNDVILGSSGPSVKSTLSARAPRQGLVFDGTSYPTFSAVSLTGNFTFSWVQNVPDTSARCVFSDGSGNFIDLPSSGTVRVFGGGVEWTSAYTAGVNQHFCLTRSGTTYVLYQNGVSLGSQTGNSSTFATSQLGAYYNGANSFSLLSVIGIYNRALSSSEVVALYEAGAPAGADYNAPNAMTFSSFGGTATGTANATSGNVSTTGSGHGYVNYSFPRTFSVGQKVLISFNVTAVTGQVSAYFPLNAYITPLTFSTTGVKTQTVTITTAGNAGTFDVDPSVNFTFDSFTVTPLGLLLAPDAYQAGGGTSWYDTSGNSATITLPASGVSWNVPTSGKIATNLTVSGTGNSTFGGNLGIGVTPSAWSGVQPVIEVGSTAGTASLFQNGVDDFWLVSNAYFNGANWIYKKTGTASQYHTTNGSHQWYSAASGTAGNAISFGDAKATLTSSGNLLIGTTTDAGQKLQVNGTSLFAGAVTASTGSLTVSKTSNDSLLKVSTTGAGAFVQIDSATDGYMGINLQSGGVYKWSIGALNGSEDFAVSRGDGSTNRYFTIGTTGDATFAGTVKVKNQATISANGTVAVGTSATTIFSTLNTSAGNFCIVFGDNGTHGFVDLVVTIGAGSAVSVISSSTVYGSPPSRTYTSTGSNLQLAMASGTLYVRTTCINTGS